MKLLVVEDEPALNKIIAKRLKVENYAVDSALDGEEALEYLAVTEYDGAIVDIMMPRLDGLTLVKKLRAKNNLLPPPVKKRYSKNHLLMLILIYYFKNVISFRDIEQLFSPISEHHFSHGSSPELEELYNEIFSLEKGQRKRLQEDVMAKFDAASQTFKDYDCEDREYLQLFAFISELAFDVYLKKQMIEILAEQLRQETPVNPKKKK